MADEHDAHGLRSAASRFAVNALALTRTRLELASVELAEERERLQLRILLLFAGVLLLLFALLGVGAFVVLQFWETSRVAALLGVSALFAGFGLYLVYRAHEVGREAPTPFAATIAELEKDREWLAGRGPER